MLAIIYGLIAAIIVICINKDHYWNFKKSWSIIAIFIVTTILVYILISNINFFNNIISKSSYPIYDKFVVFLTSMSISILIDGIFINIIQKIYENNIIKMYEKNYKIENYQYYREILKTKSPAILSFCYNRKINVEDAVVSIILNLQKQGIIEFKENKIKVIGDTLKLSKHERYVINSKSYDQKFEREFKQLLINDLIKDQYIYMKDEKEIDIVYSMRMFILWMLIYTVISIPIFMKLSNIGILIFLSYFLTFIGIPIYTLIYNNINSTVRNEKALELSAKLNGLKNYIKDYSNIKDSTVNSIILYDEYIIYCIILDIKGNLNDECKQIYQNIKSNLIYN